MRGVRREKGEGRRGKGKREKRGNEVVVEKGEERVIKGGREREERRTLSLGDGCTSDTLVA